MDSMGGIVINPIKIHHNQVSKICHSKIRDYPVINIFLRRTAYTGTS